MEKIKNIISKIKTFALSHKILSVLVLIILVASPFAINYFLPKKTTVNYVTQAVKKGSISVSVSGTGQVSSLKDVDLSAEVSGDVTGVYVDEGEEVNKGDVLFRIDSTDGAQSVKSAELALESAELDLEEMQEPVDELTLIQAENSLIDAQESKEQAENNLEKSYDDGFNDISNVFLDLPDIMLGLDNLLLSTTISKSTDNNATQSNIYYYCDSVKAYDSKIVTYEQALYDSYLETKELYDQNFDDYKNTTRYSSEEDIEKLISQTYNTVKKISDTIKASNNYIQYYKDILSGLHMTATSYADTHLSTLSGYTSKTNSHLSTLLSDKNNINSYKESIVSAERNIKVKELSLEDTKEGATDLEIRTQKLAVEEKKQALAEAENTLAKYTITAPFSGTISSVDVDKSDNVNSGTIMGSIITNDMIATVTLNEVDIAKIEVGQKVELTFDALDDVTVEGEVANVDATGTVSQGVVSYSVEISFETDNTSIKPGMSISANIIIESVSDVLTTLSSAVKTMGSVSFVEVLNNGVTERKTVETGLTDDATIEIKSGLSEGDKVITSTTSTTTKKTSTTTEKTTTKTNSTLNSLTNTGGGTPPSGGMGGPGM